MRASFRQLGIRLNASYWFLPALLTVAAVVLSIATITLDARLGPNWVDSYGWVHASKPDGARALLSSIAGGMLGVAGTVFSITIAAVVYASGNYGPRLLTNFMTDRGNQFSLGLFIADFVYCLMVMRTIRQPDEAGGGASGFVPQSSLVVAMALTLAAIGVLVYFLHHVPDSIRINGVVARVGRRALKEIDRRYPVKGEAEPSPEPPARGTPVHADEPGYIEVIDFASLRHAAGKAGLSVRLAVRAGDFVRRGSPLFRLEPDAGAEVAHALRDAFAMGESRTGSQDIEYSIDELVEIALRALSPGINDPFTAITCLHWLAAATAALGARDLAFDPDGKRYGEGGVWAIADPFDHFVARGFGSVRASAATSPLAARVFVEALDQACPDGAPHRRAVLLAEARLLLEQAELDLKGPALDGVRERVSEYLAWRRG